MFCMILTVVSDLRKSLTTVKTLITRSWPGDYLRLEGNKVREIYLAQGFDQLNLPGSGEFDQKIFPGAGI